VLRSFGAFLMLSGSIAFKVEAAFLDVQQLCISRKLKSALPEIGIRSLSLADEAALFKQNSGGIVAHYTLGRLYL
jgi:hypothetical protein